MLLALRKRTFCGKGGIFFLLSSFTNGVRRQDAAFKGRGAARRKRTTDDASPRSARFQSGIVLPHSQTPRMRTETDQSRQSGLTRFRMSQAPRLSESQNRASRQSNTSVTCGWTRLVPPASCRLVRRHLACRSSRRRAASEPAARTAALHRGTRCGATSLRSIPTRPHRSTRN